MIYNLIFINNLKNEYYYFKKELKYRNFTFIKL